MSGLLARVKRVPGEIWLLVGILAFLLPLRVLHTSNVKWMLVDGALYTEVARQVRDGNGLSTTLSLYHAGYEHFPHPSPIYPLWPWMLGMAAKVGDLASLAHWLPMTLYFTALVAAYLFGRRLWPEPMFPRVLPAFHAGHLLVLVLAFHRHFVYFTSLPYTEGISWTLLLLFLWRVFGKRDATGLGWALELGLWTGGLYFCRSQFLLVPIAVTMALGLRVLVGPDRPRAALHALVTVAVFSAMLGAWWMRIRGFVDDAGLTALLRFDQNKANDILAPLDVIVNRPDAMAILLDRLDGFRIAWDPLGKSTYHSGFIATHWALPLALPFLGIAGAAALRRDGARGIVVAARRPDSFPWVLLLLLAGGSLLSIHLAHKQFNGSWYFGQRQSLVCLLAFFLALGWMLRQQRSITTVLGVLVLATTVTFGAREVYHQAVLEGGAVRGADKQGELVRWLARRVKAEGPLVIAIAGGDANRAAWRTKDVGYHWVYESTSYADVLKMMDRLGAKYFFYEEDETRRWRFRRESAGQLEQDFERVPGLPNGHTILARRTTTPAPLPAQKVIVVGVDGASWKVMEPMIERGELPTFERLRVEGASQVNFDTLAQTDSPVVWTTVATGRDPDDHGVTDYTQNVPGVGKVPITSNARKVPALWNVASDGGRSVAVVNWWASWPAEPVNGTIVSDHANPAAAGWMEGQYWKADPEKLKALRQDTWPAAYAETLAPLWIDPAAFPMDEFQGRARLTDAQLAELAAAPFNDRSTYSWLKTFYAVDRPHLQIALDQLRTAPPDLTLLYLRGPDPVQHYAWDTVEPDRYAKPPKHLERDTGVVQGIYRFVDTFLAEVLATAGPDTTVIVLSDHGAEPAEDAIGAKRTGRPGAHTRAAKGVLFLWGPNVRRGVSVERAGPLDIAPTVAWALGLPVADDLPGRVLADAFTLDFRERRGRVHVDTWGTRDVDVAAEASPADANMLDQLRGLGYIE